MWMGKEVANAAGAPHVEGLRRNSCDRDLLRAAAAAAPQARHGAAEAARAVAALQASLTDCTFAGLALTTVSLLYCGLRHAPQPP